MSKLILLILFCTALLSEELPLSEKKTELLKLQREKVSNDAQMGEKSWISPVILSISANKNKNATNLESDIKNAGLEWSQDIFRSGGIDATIAQSKASGEADMLGVDMQEASYLKRAYTLLAQSHRDTLKYKQDELTLRNRDIDLLIIKAKYKVGSADISELNRIAIDKDSARTNLLTIKDMIKNEKYELKKFIGERDIDAIVLPKIPLISKEEYLESHLELLQYMVKDRRDDAVYKVTRSSYLPKFTLNGSFGYSDYEGQISNYEGNSYSYGAVLSMPLDINYRSEIESKHLQFLQTKTAEIDRKQELEQEYETHLSTIKNSQEKIEVAQEMLKMYEELYGFTDAQVKAGEKSTYDLESLGNSLKIQKAEKEIQNYNIFIEKISLYLDIQH